MFSAFAPVHSSSQSKDAGPHFAMDPFFREEDLVIILLLEWVGAASSIPGRTNFKSVKVHRSKVGSMKAANGL